MVILLKVALALRLGMDKPYWLFHCYMDEVSHSCLIEVLHHFFITVCCCDNYWHLGKRELTLIVKYHCVWLCVWAIKSWSSNMLRGWANHQKLKYACVIVWLNQWNTKYWCVSMIKRMMINIPFNFDVPHFHIQSLHNGWLEILCSLLLSNMVEW